MSEFAFSSLAVDRHSALRNNPVALETARTDPTTHFVAVWRSRCLTDGTRIALLAPENVSAYTQNPQRSTLLGMLDGHAVFAVAIDTHDEPNFGVAMQFIGLREISARLTPADASLAAYAKAMIAWQNNHRYCGSCGAPNETAEGGFVVVCTNSDCDQRSFPRLDPAVIVLVHQTGRALLGRQLKWPDKRFSTIAGFVEPGESLEDAVRREVTEETNIKVGEITYAASQPWPFPAALMIGFHARGLSADIQLNDGELAEARWVSREEITSGDIILPPKISIAYHLIESWFDQYDGPKLNLPDAPLRTPRPVDKNV